MTQGQNLASWRQTAAGDRQRSWLNLSHGHRQEQPHHRPITQEAQGDKVGGWPRHRVTRDDIVAVALDADAMDEGASLIDAEADQAVTAEGGVGCAVDVVAADHVVEGVIHRRPAVRRG